MRKAQFVNLTVLLLLGAQSTLARDWVAFSSDNFTIYSDRKEEDVLRMLERFEIFRQVALEMIAAPDLQENERLRIVLFDRNVDYYRIQRDRNIEGFFYHGISGPRMIVSPDGAADVLFHEYVHYLMDRHSDANYPRWYSEGLASLLESVVINDELVRVGMPTSNFGFGSVIAGLSGSHLQPAPIGEMISIEPRVGAGLFYATAWLMTHYFLIESIEKPERIEQTADYLLRFDAGEDPLAAFESAYGVSPQEMDRELDAYSSGQQFKTIVFPSIDYLGGLSNRELSEEESLYLLADLSAELGQNDMAERHLQRFERRGDDPLFGPRMQAIKAVVLVHEESVEAGDAILEQLISLDVDDADVVADIIHYATDRILYARENDKDLGTSQLERAIELGTSVVREDPMHAETLFYLGRAHELMGNLRFAGEALLRFAAINPTAPEANLLLSKVFFAGGNADLGSLFLARVYSASHSEDARAKIDDIRDRIDDVEFVVDALEGLLR